MQLSERTLEILTRQNEHNPVKLRFALADVAVKAAALRRVDGSAGKYDARDCVTAGDAIDAALAALDKAAMEVGR